MRAEHGPTARIRVHAKPGASRSAVLGWTAGELAVAVRAPPVDNRANEALVELIAKVLGVSRTQVAVVSGATSRHKVLIVSGVEQPVVNAALGLPSG